MRILWSEKKIFIEICRVWFYFVVKKGKKIYRVYNYINISKGVEVYN